MRSGLQGLDAHSRLIQLRVARTSSLLRPETRQLKLAQKRPATHLKRPIAELLRSQLKNEMKP